MKSKVSFLPIEKECTYFLKDEKGECKNCGGSRKYIDGYHLIYEKNGKKYAFSVDTLK